LRLSMFLAMKVRQLKCLKRVRNKYLGKICQELSPRVCSCPRFHDFKISIMRPAQERPVQNLQLHSLAEADLRRESIVERMALFTTITNRALLHLFGKRRAAAKQWHARVWK